MSNPAVVAGPDRFPPVGASGRIQPYSTPKAVALHLLPAVPALLGYSLLAAGGAVFGWPPLLSLHLSVGLVEIPVLWFLMRHLVRREGGEFTFTSLFPWSRSLSLRSYATVGVPLVLLGMVIIGGLRLPLEAALLGSVFNWVPQWFIADFSPAAIAGWSRGMAFLMAATGLVFATVAGGVTQELYFRGFLLPRMKPSRWRTPLLNGALFAMYHAASPWNWPAFAVMAVPWAVAVYRKRSVRIGLFIHIGMLLLGWLMFLAMITGVVPVAAMGGQ